MSKSVAFGQKQGEYHDDRLEAASQQDLSNSYSGQLVHFVS
jgi:hypothetical protein